MLVRAVDEILGTHTLKQAQMTCEKPRRYQAAASGLAPAGTTI
jgi:hypothetical protein